MTSKLTTTDIMLLTFVVVSNIMWWGAFIALMLAPTP
jgi:hypothetical protein